MSRYTKTMKLIARIASLVLVILYLLGLSFEITVVSMLLMLGVMVSD